MNAIEQNWTEQPTDENATHEIIALRAAYVRWDALEAEGIGYGDARNTSAVAAIDAGWRALRTAMQPTTPCPIAAEAISARDVKACRDLDLARCTPEQVRESGKVATEFAHGYASSCGDDSIAVRGTVASGPHIRGVAVADVAAFAWSFGLPVTHARAARLVADGHRAPGETRTLEDAALDGLERAAEREMGGV